MPLQDIKFRPGIDREGTATSVEGTWYEGNNVRFRSGLPEKIGGWQADVAVLDPVLLVPPFGSFWGIARHLFNWMTLARSNMLGIGTSMKYYLQNGIGGIIYDVTPISSTTTPGGVTFAAVNGSAVLTVNDVAHGAFEGDFVIFSGAVTLGGNITAAVLNREHQIASVIGANSYTVVASATANASDVGNGGVAAVATYLLPNGDDIFTPGLGWGAGGWGGSTYGTLTGWGESASLPTSIGLQPRLWSAANFGERLLVNPRGGAIYLWTPNADPSIVARLVLLSGGDTPTVCNVLLVSDASRFVLTFGVNDYGETLLDPMLVRWSDQESYTEWTPSATNQAGSYRLSRGSVILTAVQTRQEVLVWTDAALYSMQYQGPPFVWSTQILADNVTLLGPNAVCSFNNITYWMGPDRFYVYNGRVEPLPCTLLRFVFADINVEQGFQAHAGHNEAFNEVWWFYCSADSTVIDRYVIYNYLENVWSYGELARTVWLDSRLREKPVAATDGNKLVYHEQGVDDVEDDTPLPVPAFISSAPVDIDAGQRFSFIRRMQPDVTFAGSTVDQPSITVTLRTRPAAGAPYYTPGQANPVQSAQDYSAGQRHLVQQFTQEIYPRLRGQQVQLTIESDTLGVAWQWGVSRIDVRQDGRK
jgi:hypothetical protein